MTVKVQFGPLPALPADEVESPCIKVCALDASGSYCTGCYRSRAEIGAWSRAGNREKREIVSRAAARQKQLSGQGRP